MFHSLCSTVFGTKRRQTKFQLRTKVSVPVEMEEEIHCRVIMDDEERPLLRGMLSCGLSSVSWSFVSTNFRFRSGELSPEDTSTVRAFIWHGTELQ